MAPPPIGIKPHDELPGAGLSGGSIRTPIERLFISPASGLPYQKGDKMPKYNKNQVIKFPGAIEDARLKTKTVGDETAKIITFTVATRYSKALHALIGELCGGTAAVEIGTHQMDLISAIDSATGEQVE